MLFAMPERHAGSPVYGEEITAVDTLDLVAFSISRLDDLPMIPGMGNFLQRGTASLDRQ
jgi:hypothetical protein